MLKKFVHRIGLSGIQIELRKIVKLVCNTYMKTILVIVIDMYILVIDNYSCMNYDGSIRRENHFS